MTKSEIKAWLKAIGKNRAWLAGELGHTLNTVNDILYSQKPISARTEKLLALLMQQHPASVSASAPAPAPEVPENVLVLHASAPEFRAWNAAALAAGQLVADWAAGVLNDAAAEMPE